MIGVSLPKISCVLVTKGRVKHVKQSIHSYLAQTYTNKELIVLSQGDRQSNQEIDNYIKSLKCNIGYYEVSPRLNLGEMRNTSVEIATGDLICQWDDDDLYHPDRLMSQYRVLRTDSRMVASMYCEFLKYFKTSGELYWCDWHNERILTHRFLCGTIMFPKKIFTEFRVFYPQSGPQSHVEEDLHILNKLTAKGNIGSVFSGHQYIYVYHGSNTYDIEHHNLTLDTSWNKQLRTVPELLASRSLIEESLQLARIKESVVVRSKDEIAFTFNTK